MPKPNRWRLVTTRDLVAFHTTRSDVYRTAAEVLIGPLHGPQLAVMVTRLARAAARTPGFLALERWRDALAAAREASDHAALTEPLRACGLLGCANPGEPARNAALKHVHGGSGSERASELLAMAVLAGRTADALEQARFAEAASLSLVQAEFLRAHGGACLGALAEGLASADVPVLAASGAPLRTLLEDDLEYLAAAADG